LKIFHFGPGSLEKQSSVLSLSLPFSFSLALAPALSLALAPALSLVLAIALALAISMDRALAFDLFDPKVVLRYAQDNLGVKKVYAPHPSKCPLYVYYAKKKKIISSTFTISGILIVSIAQRLTSSNIL
jgi:hypothetical protein